MTDLLCPMACVSNHFQVAFLLLVTATKFSLYHQMSHGEISPPATRPPVSDVRQQGSCIWETGGARSSELADTQSSRPQGGRLIDTLLPRPAHPSTVCKKSPKGPLLIQTRFACSEASLSCPSSYVFSPKGCGKHRYLMLRTKIAQGWCPGRLLAHPRGVKLCLGSRFSPHSPTNLKATVAFMAQMANTHTHLHTHTHTTQR